MKNLQPRLFLLFLTLILSSTHGRLTIYKGDSSKIHEFPFAVLLASTKYSCTGSLITGTKIISAAHCVCNPNAVFQAIFGRSSFSDKQGYSTKIIKSYTDPEFKICQELIEGKESEDEDEMADIAVLQVEFDMTKLPAGIKKVPVNYKDKWVVGRYFTSIGFGYDDHTGDSHKLKKAVLKSGKCPITYEYEMICALLEENEQYIDDGDSGGPVYVPETNSIYGVASGVMKTWASEFAIYASFNSRQEFVKQFI